jgi:hypothetical protein
MTIWPRLLLNEAGCNRDAGKGALDRLRRDRGAIAMEERGGPTTQAGIRYQNSAAALYLGDLLRWDIPHPAERARERYGSKRHVQTGARLAKPWPLLSSSAGSMPSGSRPNG